MGVRLARAIALVGLGGVGSLAAQPSEAATVLTGYQTYGSAMDGLEVTVGFLDGAFETQIWRDTGRSQEGGAFGSSWSLVQRGDTFPYPKANPWRFDVFSRPVQSLILNAVPGNTVFDVIENREVTPGSAGGFNFAPTRGPKPNGVSYSVPIDISQGDLFGSLTLVWSNGFTGSVEFLADTDSGTTTNPVTIVPPPPAPAPPVPPTLPVIPPAPPSPPIIAPSPPISVPVPIVPDPAPPSPGPTVGLPPQTIPDGSTPWGILALALLLLGRRAASPGRI